MSKKILIDASNPNETRVAVTDKGKLDDFEIESNKKNAVKGDVYLAKITRVEPSLQAAFVDFGANRNGFLPLTEIHPDYFKIPSADETKLKELLDNQSNLEQLEELEEATVTGNMFFKIKTGSATNHFSTNFDIVSEQLWLSGLRQKENTEYFTVNAQSRLISSTFKSGFSDTIYNNEGDFLNT